MIPPVLALRRLETTRHPYLYRLPQRGPRFLNPNKADLVAEASGSDHEPRLIMNDIANTMTRSDLPTTAGQQESLPFPLCESSGAPIQAPCVEWRGSRLRKEGPRSFHEVFADLARLECTPRQRTQTSCPSRSDERARGTMSRRTRRSMRSPKFEIVPVRVVPLPVIGPCSSLNPGGGGTDH